MAFAASHRLQYIPARGRRRISVIVHVCEIGNFSFSPRGDGNSITIAAMSEYTAIAIYPRKGTETYHTRGKRSNGNIAIYPRKGTKATLFS